MVELLTEEEIEKVKKEVLKALATQLDHIIKAEIKKILLVKQKNYEEMNFSFL